jgi:hypothetical protein
MGILNDLVPSSSGFLPLDEYHYSTYQAGILRGLLASVGPSGVMGYTLHKELFGQRVDQVRVVELARSESDWKTDIFIFVRLLGGTSSGDILLVCNMDFFVRWPSFNAVFRCLDDLRNMHVMRNAQIRIDTLEKVEKRLNVKKVILREKRLAFDELDNAGKQLLRIEAKQARPDYVGDAAVKAGIKVHAVDWKARANARVNSAVALAATVGY